MIIGRGMSPGIAYGEAIVCNQSLSPLGELSKSGFIVNKECEGKTFINKILIFKGGRGSTVGSYVILELKEKGLAPSGIINEEAEQVVLTGAIISEIPMVDRIPIDIFQEGDKIRMNGKSGIIEIENVIERDIATVYLINNNRLLLLKRSESVGTYKGQYAGVSGFIEEGEEPEFTGKRELLEECEISDAKLVKKGDLLFVRNGNILFRITPMIMTTDTERIKLNWENDEFKWVKLDELNSYDTVPKFKETFFHLFNQS